MTMSELRNAYETWHQLLTGHHPDEVKSVVEYAQVFAPQLGQSDYMTSLPRQGILPAVQFTMPTAWSSWDYRDIDTARQMERRASADVQVYTCLGLFGDNPEGDPRLMILGAPYGRGNRSPRDPRKMLLDSQKRKRARALSGVIRVRLGSDVAVMWHLQTTEPGLKFHLPTPVVNINYTEAWLPVHRGALKFSTIALDTGRDQALQALNTIFATWQWL